MLYGLSLQLLYNMTLTTIGFPQVMADNELAYFSLLEGVIDSIDELASLRITRKPTAYAFVLTPSLARYTQPLLSEILLYHNLMGIQLHLSKSIRTTSTIQFDIVVQDS